MPKAAFTLINDVVRARALQHVRSAPEGYRVTIEEPRRTLDQNAKLWSLLSEFAEQVEHHGRRYSAEAWKAIFLHALGKETQFVPSLEGDEVIPLGMSSSALGKRDFSDLLEMVYAEGAKRGVVFKETRAA